MQYQQGILEDCAVVPYPGTRANLLITRDQFCWLQAKGGKIVGANSYVLGVVGYNSHVSDWLLFYNVTG